MFHSAQGNETTMTGQETLLSRICAGGIVENPRLPLPELEYTPKLCKTVPSNVAMDCSYGSYGVFISTHEALQLSKDLPGWGLRQVAPSKTLWKMMGLSGWRLSEVGRFGANMAKRWANFGDDFHGIHAVILDDEFIRCYNISRSIGSIWILSCHWICYKIL
jgi:hypothetical protein